MQNQSLKLQMTSIEYWYIAFSMAQM